REENAAQAKGEQPGTQPEQPAHRRRGDDLQRERQLKRLEEDRRRIGAEPEERGRAEVYVARVSAEDVPRRRQHDEHEHGIAGEEEVFVLQDRREGDRTAQRDRARDPELHARLIGRTVPAAARRGRAAATRTPRPAPTTRRTASARSTR